MIQLAAKGIRATFDPNGGHLPGLVIDGVQVLHTAPWRAEPDIQSDTAIPWVDRRLGGTFVCAPFGLDDVDHGPPHGAPANNRWHVTATSPQALTATLAVPRGSIRAQIALRPGHPVLYQTHTLDLAQPCTFAHHPMFRLAAGGEVSTGPLKCVRTFAAPTAEGHALYHPGQVTSGDVLETSAGPRPWRQYPDQTCEDFLAIVHRPGLAWTALRRHGEGDTLLLLKRSEQLPLTCLWMSNGGRQSSPWNGCHGGVLGIEDAICAGADGFAAALSGATDLSEDHVPLALPPGRHVIPHAILRIPEALTVTDVTLDDALRVQTTEGPHTVPFAPEHFQ